MRARNATVSIGARDRHRVSLRKAYAKDGVSPVAKDGVSPVAKDGVSLVAKDGVSPVRLPYLGLNEGGAPCVSGAPQEYI
ncbi:MAG: hypothetical protein HUU46_12365 [Candidatus Hydrogenedentes bacterium]|nr:hypothetical protein [Candidatus Hydrogenedentota bacterium]